MSNTKEKHGKEYYFNILAGPDSMELGWLVCRWIPILRGKFKTGKNIVVVCKPGNEYLYSDFCNQFEYYEQKGDHDRWLASCKPDVPLKIPKHIRVKYPNRRIMEPSKHNCGGYKFPTRYERYGIPYDKSVITEYDLIIHARAETKYGQKYRNWPIRKYEKLLEKLDYPKAASIGLRGKAYHIPGTDDLRNIPMEQLCQTLAAALVVAGPSSGPMHLAHLCGTPIIVWTDKKPQKALRNQKTNGWRYTVEWRPFRFIPVTVVENEGWDPHPSTIAKYVGEEMKHQAKRRHRW